MSRYSSDVLSRLVLKFQPLLSHFFEHLAQGDKPMGISAFLKIRAPEVQLLYLGYVEMSISVMGHHFPVMGFMVVKDSHNADFAEKKKECARTLRM